MAEVVSVPGSDTLLRRKLKEILSTGVATMLANELGSSAFHAGSPILQIRDLRTYLLKPASLSLSAGECIAIRGPSGAGKTLLLRAIADLDPNEGLVCLDGRDRSTIAGPEWRRLVGYVPAEPGWWADTVGEHFSGWTAALAVVRDLGFPKEAKAWPITRLSTGERPRLALIRALMVRPKVLLLDEPTAGPRSSLRSVGRVDLPPVWWTPMLGFRAGRKVSDEHNAPGISGGLQTRSG